MTVNTGDWEAYEDGSHLNRNFKNSRFMSGKKKSLTSPKKLKLKRKF